MDKIMISNSRINYTNTKVKRDNQENREHPTRKAMLLKRKRNIKQNASIVANNT